jgi:collagenase-like PrtC family protease
MKLSVACTFEPGLIERLAEFSQVFEVYGKLGSDIFGGGRSSYTLRHPSRRNLARTVAEAHRHGIGFNYLLNGATLGGLEQTRAGQKAIRRQLDLLAEADVDSVTIASPYLLRLVKRQYPRFSVRISVFAVVDSPEKARQWEEMGADTICVSAIACNRDFERLSAIRQAVTCDLQLIANAGCLLGCAYELTHMNLLTESSRKGSRLGGYCLDYCFLNCSSKKLRHPVNLIRATWIRPEDLGFYEDIGYHNFKIVERSCPGDLLVKRVRAYVERRFDGNLLEIVGPVAAIKKQLGASAGQRARVVATMFRPTRVKLGPLLEMKRYADSAILHEYDRGRAPVYIENRSLAGFLEGIKTRRCSLSACESCRYCHEWADRVVAIDPTYREQTLSRADALNTGLDTSTLWL